MILIRSSILFRFSVFGVNHGNALETHTGSFLPDHLHIGVKSLTLNEYGLGVHVTHDMAGNLHFGPDVEWIDEIDDEVDPQRSEVFYEAIRSYWPDLMDKSLLPAYAGIRPKINGPGLPAVDFAIQDETEHGVAGLINLFGIESPGLTSSLALADCVTEMLT